MREQKRQKCRNNESGCPGVASADVYKKGVAAEMPSAVNGGGYWHGMAVAMAYVHQTSLLASILTFGAEASSTAIADRSDAPLSRV